MDYSFIRAEEYNCRIKIAPNGDILEELVCSQKIFHPCGEIHQHKKSKLKTSNKEVIPSEENISRSIRRAKNSIYDYVICNDDLDLFVTLTLDKENVNRYDYNEIIKKLNNWLDNHKRRNGLKYVLVPEYHKDGAIHFHGFFNSSSLRLEDSGHKTVSGQIIYNLPQFRLGFTTGIITVGSRSKIANYICKYITKQTDNKVGGRYYLHSNNLLTPTFDYCIKDFATSCGYEFDIPCTKLSFKKIIHS